MTDKHALAKQLTVAAENLWQRLQGNLKLTAESSVCKNTHDLSVSLTRLLTLNRALKMLYGKSALPIAKTVKIRAFRRKLSQLRDTQEMLLKVQSLKTPTAFHQYLCELLIKCEQKQQRALPAQIKRLSGLRLGAYFTKENIPTLTEKKLCESRGGLLTELLEKVHQLRPLAIAGKDDNALHKMRVRFKLFRYTAELLCRVPPEEFKPVSEYLRSVQTELGEAHDWLVLEQWLRSITVPENISGLGEFYSLVRRRQEAANDRARAYLETQWNKLRAIAGAEYK